MACLLNIETSTNVCSVAVSENGQCIWHEEDFGGPNHNERLGTYVDEALSFADSHAIPIDGVAVSMGPGSYTGLRIGVSMAKGVCYGFNVPLLAVPTLECMCVPVLLSERFSYPSGEAEGTVAGEAEGTVAGEAEGTVAGEALLCPMLDARRMEVYAAVYNRSLRLVRDVQADVVDADTYKAFLDEHPVYFFGNGAMKCKEVINHPNAHFIDGINPLAKNMFPIAERRFLQNKTEDVAYFVPFYLKDFVAIKSKSPLLTSPRGGNK